MLIPSNKSKLELFITYICQNIFVNYAIKIMEQGKKTSFYLLQALHVSNYIIDYVFFVRMVYIHELDTFEKQTTSFIIDFTVIPHVNIRRINFRVIFFLNSILNS